MRRRVATAIACAAGALMLVTGAGGRDAAIASVPKPWLPIPVTGAVSNIVPLGTASGRLWFEVQSVGGGGAGFTVWSAKVQGTHLTAFVPSPVGDGNAFIVGSNLVWCCPSGTADPQEGLSALRADGSLGAWAPIPDAPAQAAQGALTPPNTTPNGRWTVNAGAVVAGRPVWLVAGGSCPPSGARKCTVNGGGIPTVAACCVGGAPVDLTSVFGSTTQSAGYERLSVDSHGRLWLAWLSDTRRTPTPSFVDIVQLQPSTLTPVGTRKTINGHVESYGATLLFLPCADTCRAVYESTQGAYAWDGTAAPTRLWLNDARTDKGGALLAADAHAGALRVGFERNRVPTVPDDGQRLSLLRGDARGRNLRAVASVDIPKSLPKDRTHVKYGGPSAALLVPQGLVYFEAYATDIGADATVIATVLRG